MKLARRMSRLGTESAFEVLVKARALEAKGKDVIHLEIGEPDFDTPAHIVEGGIRERGHRGLHFPNARDLREPGAGRCNARGQAHHVLQHHRARGRGR